MPDVDRHASALRSLIEAVLAGPGESSAEHRRAAARNEGVPEDLRALVDEVHRRAHEITDDEVARLRERYGEDVLFEILVAASVGASQERLAAGLRALEEAT